MGCCQLRSQFFLECILVVNVFNPPFFSGKKAFFLWAFIGRFAELLFSGYGGFPNFGV